MTVQSSSSIAHQLARPNILALQPYRCARDDYDEGVLLDANENGFGPPIVSEDFLERYPDPYQMRLKEAYCSYRNGSLGTHAAIQPRNVFCGNGSDEGIDLLIRSFCEPKQSKILITPPTYGMYKVCANIHDVDIVAVPLHADFSLHTDAVIEALKQDDSIQLVFLCTPGNPTSKHLDLGEIERVAQASATSQIIVVDEAYVDFSKFPSALLILDQYPNVCVMQTLSKAFGLAGIRCGFCVGHPDLIQILNNVKAPYNVNKLTSKVAYEALQNTEKLQRTIGEILEQRQFVQTSLKALEFVQRVYESDANFLLFRLPNAQRVYKQMAEEYRVVTRYRGTELHCDNCIRVTVGTPDENKLFLEKLVQVYESLN